MKKVEKTEEQRLAYNQAARNYYKKHKDEPEFKAKRKEYINNYFKKIDKDKKKQYHNYVVDYAFYIRSVVTGRFQKKIEKNKQRLKDLQNKIYAMEDRLKDIQLRFGHLDSRHKKDIQK